MTDLRSNWSAPILDWKYARLITATSHHFMKKWIHRCSRGVHFELSVRPFKDGSVSPRFWRRGKTLRSDGVTARDTWWCPSGTGWLWMCTSVRRSVPVAVRDVAQWPQPSGTVCRRHLRWTWAWTSTPGTRRLRAVAVTVT